MAHTYTNFLYHIVFSTKHRKHLIDQEAKDTLYPYICGVVRNHGGKVLIVNGMSDHIHLLCYLRSKPSVAEVVQDMKKDSSKNYNAQSNKSPFHWQQGYGAFTVSYSQRHRVYEYIENQENHHKGKDYANEYEELLKKNGIEYDPRFFLD